MRPTRPPSLAGLVTAIGLAGVAAHAQTTPPLTLEWTAPSGCPARDDVRRRTEELLGGPVESHLHAALRASGTVVALPDHFELRLETVDGGLRGERVLHGATCEEVTAAASLIIALAVDPRAVAASQAASTTEPTTPPTTAPPSTATPTPPPPVVIAQPAVVATSAPIPARSGAPVRITGRLDAALAGDVGALPGFALGPSLSGAVGLDRVRLRLGATYFAPRFAAAPPVAGQGRPGADVSLFVARFSGCYVLGPEAISVAPCAELEGGALFAAGTGFDSSNDATTPWLGVGGAVELTVPIAGAFGFRASLGALAPLGRSPVRFRENTGDIATIHTIHRASAVSGRGELGFGVAFW